MPAEKVEVFKSLESWATKNILPILKPVEKSWQPSEFLPDPTRPNEFVDEVRALHDRTKELPDEYFVVLVGDMITEEALPTYETMLTSLDAVRDDIGSGPRGLLGLRVGRLRRTDMVICLRACFETLKTTFRSTYFQSSLSQLLKISDSESCFKSFKTYSKAYLYLSGRVDMVMIERTIHYLIGVDMVMIERTIHHLIGNEMDAGWVAFVYTSFQERATFISHGNTGRLALKSGDPIIARTCGTIAADEKRHENAYIKIIEMLLEIDPNEAMLAIGTMMRKKIVMPTHLMADGRDPHLFEHFSLIADKIGVYNAKNYVDILEFLIGRWRLEKLEGLSDDARREQDFVCSLGPKIIKLKDRADKITKNYKGLKFSWIFNKEINV